MNAVDGKTSSAPAVTVEGVDFFLFKTDFILSAIIIMTIYLPRPLLYYHCYQINLTAFQKIYGNSLYM